MISELQWVVKHSVSLPNGFCGIACFEPECNDCSAIPIERKRLAAYLRTFMNGSLPPLIRIGDRFLCLNEVENLPREEILKYQKQLPLDFDNRQWRSCKIKGCFHWKNEGTECQRHLQLVHSGMQMTDVFLKPFICTFAFPRPIGKLGVPDGPIRHCYAPFQTEAELKTHKKELKHTQSRNTQEEVAKPALPDRPLTPELGERINPTDLLTFDDPDERPDSIQPLVPIANPANVGSRNPNPNPHINSNPNVAIPNHNVIPHPIANLNPEHSGSKRSRLKKRQRSSEEPESSVDPEYSEPLQKRSRLESSEAIIPARVPPKSLKVTFFELLETIVGKRSSGSISYVEAVSEIVKLIGDKGFVRSDSVEKSAKALLRSIKNAKDSENQLVIFNSLMEMLQSLTWD